MERIARVFVSSFERIITHTQREREIGKGEARGGWKEKAEGNEM